VTRGNRTAKKPGHEASDPPEEMAERENAEKDVGHQPFVQARAMQIPHSERRGEDHTS
jgi:hypothetical protein